MEDTKIILFLWPYALECVSFDLIPYLRKMNVKLQSSGHLADSGSHEKSRTKNFSTQITGESLMYLFLSLKCALFKNHVQ